MYLLGPKKRRIIVVSKEDLTNEFKNSDMFMGLQKLIVGCANV